MRKGGGHSKGAAFERKIAKDIVKAFRKKFKDVQQKEIWRSVLSGGHDMSSGDLRMSPRMEKLFPFSVECKHRKKIKFYNFLLDGDKSEEKKWLKQALDGAKKGDLMAVLVMKANNQPIFALLNYQRWDVSKPELKVDNKPWILIPWQKFLKAAVGRARR